MKEYFSEKTLSFFCKASSTKLVNEKYAGASFLFCYSFKSLNDWLIMLLVHNEPSYFYYK